MTEYADQRAHDVFWMTAEERNQLDWRASCEGCGLPEFVLPGHVGQVLCAECLHAGRYDRRSRFSFEVMN